MPSWSQPWYDGSSSLSRAAIRHQPIDSTARPASGTSTPLLRMRERYVDRMLVGCPDDVICRLVRVWCVAGR